MFCYKLHRNRSENYELVLGICDKRLVGKVLRKNPMFLVSKEFFSGEECGEEKAVELMKKCGKCELLQFCRGCPAIAYGAHNDYFAFDPQC